METQIKKLFNYGNNDGDFTIIANDRDGKGIMCHSFVLTLMAPDYMKTFNNFTNSELKCLNLDYPSKIIVVMLDKFYGSTINLKKKLTPYEIIEYVKLLNELLIVDRENVIDELATIFSYQITENNFYDLLLNIYNVDIYAKLLDQLKLFFSNNEKLLKKLHNLILTENNVEFVRFLSSFLVDTIMKKNTTISKYEFVVRYCSHCNGRMGKKICWEQFLDKLKTISSIWGFISGCFLLTLLAKDFF